MKLEKGITLISLVIYIITATIIISTMAIVSSFFFSNINSIKDKDESALQLNNFNMFFVNDVKNNKTAQVEESKIVFEDNTIYEYNNNEKIIYRNGIQIAKDIETLKFISGTYEVSQTTKNLITVQISVGNIVKQIEYVLKYW